MKGKVMKTLSIGFLILLTSLSVRAQSGGQSHSVNAGIQDRFVGGWRLVWLEEQDAQGQLHRADCTGLLVYTPDGKMSVQVMYRNPPPANDAAPVQYAQGGYEASFGSYEINDAHTFTFHVEGALVRALIGKDLKRTYELSGNQLIVKSPDPNEHWRVVWEHY